MCVGVCAGAGAGGTRCVGTTEQPEEFLYPRSGRPGSASSALGAAGPALQETNWARLEHFLSGEEEEPRLQLEKTWCNPADPRSTGTVI